MSDLETGTVITIQFPCNCEECGAPLQGQKARYYPGRYGGKAYGINCHNDKPTPVSGFRKATNDPIQRMMQLRAR